MATTIEKTGKLWKILTLVAIVLLGVGMYYAIPALQAERYPVGSPEDNENVRSLMIGIGSFLSGLVLAVVARLGAWWCHG